MMGKKVTSRLPVINADLCPQCEPLSSQFPTCIFFLSLHPFLTLFLTSSLTLYHSCSGRTSVCPETHPSQHARLSPNSAHVTPPYLPSACLQTNHLSLICSTERRLHRDCVCMQMNMCFPRNDNGSAFKNAHLDLLIVSSITRLSV